MIPDLGKVPESQFIPHLLHSRAQTALNTSCLTVALSNPNCFLITLTEPLGLPAQPEQKPGTVSLLLHWNPRCHLLTLLPWQLSLTIGRGGDLGGLRPSH